MWEFDLIISDCECMRNSARIVTVAVSYYA